MGSFITDPYLLFALSLILVSFGQPAWFPFLAPIASIVGFALFFRLLYDIDSLKKRFWISTLWFFLVQCVQLSWLLTHPFSYIYGLYFFLTSAIGIQFGIVGALATKERLCSFRGAWALSGVWVLLEWLRLYFLSGFSFNPIGVALSGSIYPLQTASIFGIYGLSFLILLTNLLVVRALIVRKNLWAWSLAVAFALFPYLFGIAHYTYHDEKSHAQGVNTLRTLLVQTAFPIEEIIPFQSWQSYVRYTEEEWGGIFSVLAPFKDKGIELIALPEYVVPFGTYMAVFSYERILQDLQRLFGKEVVAVLPPVKEPLALEVEGKWQVTNAFICQALSNIFKADLVAGLQDDQWISSKEQKSYSSGFYFWPGGSLGLRYEKQILLPMAEYIPLDFLRKMAAEYGISGSFTCGSGAKVFPGSRLPFGLSICYEETYGHLMRENRLKGAELLVNLTSDVWYPDSRLPKQHFDHARLRTVESGIPLIRACNTGITSAIDSLGRIVAQGKEEQEWERFALMANVPLYHYKTLYSIWGDYFIIAICLLSLLFLRISKQ